MSRLCAYVELLADFVDGPGLHPASYRRLRRLARLLGRDLAADVEAF